MLRLQEAVAAGAAVPSLVRWGRSPDADLVYRMLVLFGPDTAHELERGLGMPRVRIAAAVEELRSIDAVRRVAGSARDMVWAARSPTEVLAALHRRRFGPRVMPSQHPGRHPLTTHLPTPGRRMLGEGLRHLPSRAAARVRLGELVAVARHEHLAINTERVFEADSARAAAPMDRALILRGVRMRVIGLSPPDHDPLAEYWPRLDSERPDYRMADAVPMKLIVVDRKVALLPVVPGDLARGYLEVAQPPVVEALVALFERHWDAARAPRGDPPPTVLHARERALVELLARGHTDATAARELRVSQRTVSSMLRHLMDRFGADNRFQLGLALGAAGSVHPPNLPQEDR